MDDEVAFVAALARDPEQLASYLAFADWLTEHGDQRGPHIQVVAGAGEPELFRYNGGFYASWKERGVSLMFDTRADTLHRVFLFPGGRDGYSRYPGELPAGLRFSDSRADVEAKLGPPDEWDPFVPDWAIYPRAGLEMRYEARPPAAPTDPLRHVMVFRPRPPSEK